MKKLLAMLLVLAMISCLFVACANNDSETDAPTTAPTDESKTNESTDNSDATEPDDNNGDVKIAMITDYGDITDQSFNQTTYEACQKFAGDNGYDFKYYKPTDNSTAGRVASTELAIADGYNVIVMPGYAFGGTIVEVAPQYPNVKFIALDVSEYDLTSNGVDLSKASNLFSAVYQEELSGYMAGYAAGNIVEGTFRPFFAEALDGLDDSSVLVDVRTDEEFAQGHIPGAIHCELEKMRGQLDMLPKDKELIIYCRVGLRGYVAERLLEQKGYDPLAYRFFCLQSHYRKSLVFTWENLDNAVAAYNKLIAKIANIKDEGGVDEAVRAEYRAKFMKEMDNDLNTAMGVTALYDVLKAKTTGATKLAIIGDYDTVLSLDLLKKAEAEREKKEKAASQQSAGGFTVVSEDGTADEGIENLIRQRAEAKKAKNFAEADRIRDELKAQGVEVTDMPGGAKWKRV